MKRLCALTGTMMFLLSCGSSPSVPTAPSSITTAPTTGTAPFPPPAPPGTSRALTGAVTAGNTPIAGANVFVLAVGWYGSYTTEATAVTDGNGMYTMPDVRAYAGADAIGWLLVGASKPGYFADFKWWLDFPADADLNLRLERWTTTIRLGEAIRGQIGQTECAGLGYGGWYGQRAPCQRFALAAPASGTLELSMSAPDFNFDVDVVNPDGTFAAYVSSSRPVRVDAPVQAGSTYEIRVAGGWSSARDFEFTAQIR